MVAEVTINYLIYIYIFVNVAPVIAFPLSCIFNLSVTASCVPSIWKSGIVIVAILAYVGYQLLLIEYICGAAGTSHYRPCLQR